MGGLIFKLLIFWTGSKNSFLSYSQFGQAKPAVLINVRSRRRRPSADVVAHAQILSLKRRRLG